MLKASEWNTINDILYELYRQDELTALSGKLMRLLRSLIPYTKGYLLILDETGAIKEKDSCFIAMSQKEVYAYLHKYYFKDYLQMLYEFDDTKVYRDTDILDDERRERTEFFRQFLLPADIPYGCGIVVMHSGEVCAVFNLFRNKELGDFTDRELEILNIFKKHVETMISRLVCTNQREQLIARCYDEVRGRYGLTERETEVLRLITEGLSNGDICEQLFVSLSTVKKHIYHIFSKMQVKSRAQLIHELYRLQAA